jgi:hypothetical protein
VVAEIAVNAIRISILTVLVAALGAYLYWVEVPHATREAAGSRLFDADPDTITRIRIDFPDRTMTLERLPAGWRLTAPLDAAADDAQVNGLLTSVTAATADRTLDDDGENAATFGFGPDAPRIELTRADGRTLTATIGRTTPIGAKTYVVAGDDTRVRLTTTDLRATVDKQPVDLRDKRLVDFEDDAVARVVIARADEPAVVLTRTDRDAWVVDPGEYVADVAEVRSYLSTLRATRAVDFVDENPTDLTRFGLAPPKLDVSVFTDDDSPAASLHVGAEFSADSATRLYAKRADAPNIVALGEWSRRSLDRDVGAFRDKTVLAFDPERIGSFTIERAGGATLTFARRDERWALDDEDAGAIDPQTVERYLADLRDLKGASIVAEPPPTPTGFGLDAPSLRVRLADRDGAPVGEVLASEHEGSYYAMQAGAGVVYETRDYMYARIDKARDAFTPLPVGTPEGG